MANSALKSKTYKVDEPQHKFLGTTISYPNLKMSKSRLEQAKDTKNFSEFDRRGGEETLKWINNVLKTDRDAIHNTKQIGMDAGRENEFIKTHDKDKDNANPTAVGGLPLINKGSIKRKIMNNTEVYNESFNKEISSIKYLIEYMNKNNKKQKI